MIATLPRDRLIAEWARRAQEHRLLAMRYESLRTSTAQRGGPLTSGEISLATAHGIRGLR